MMERSAKQTKQPDARTRNYHLPSHSVNRRAKLRPVLTALAMLLLLLLVVPTATQPVSAQTVVATVAVGTSPRGVAVNPATNRIYVANWISNNVKVIDGATDTVVATVPVGTSPWGVAVNPSTNRIYVANQASADVSVIDGNTNTVVATVPVGTWPVGVAVNPSTSRIYVTNTSSNNVSVINGNTNTVVATVPVGTGPVGVAVNPCTNRIYVANTGSNNVSVINGANNTVVATVPVGTSPRGVAVNPTTSRIYVTNNFSNNVSVINGTTNTVVATVPVGTGPWGVAVNPCTNRIYVANGSSNNVSVIFDPDTTPPATVTDLTVTKVTTNSVTLSWTAPGDDGNVCPTSQYDIRYSTSPITEANWASATQCVGEPAPQPPGTTQTFTVPNLAPGPYYFALQTADEMPNWSGLSNVVTATILVQAGRRASPSTPTPPRILNPAQMSLQYVSVNPQQTSANQPVTITTNVVNTGDEAGNLNLALKINGQVEQSRMVSVGPQGTQPVKFTVTRAQPGTYTVDILGKSGSFTVLGAGGTTGAPANSGLIVLLIIGVLVLSTVVVLLVSRRPAR